MSSGGGGSQTVGYRYYLGMHIGVCIGPVDAVLELRAGDRTAWTGNVTASGQINVNAPDLFGGEEREGGVAGAVDVMMGEPAQAANGYLASKQSGPQPAYRGILGFVYRQCLLACNNPYIKAHAWKVKRILKGWPSDLPWYAAKAPVSIPSTAAPPPITLTPVSAATADGFGTSGILSSEDSSISMNAPAMGASSTYLASFRFEPDFPGDVVGLEVTAFIKIDGLTIWSQPVTFDGSGEFFLYRQINYVGHSAALFQIGFTSSAPWDGAANCITAAIPGATVYEPVSEASDIGPDHEDFGVIRDEGGNLFYAAYSNGSVGGSDLWGGPIYGEVPGVGEAMNPAHIIYECLTNGDWGMGYGAGLIDDANFRAAADLFYAEGMGLCMQWTEQQQIEAFIQHVLDHCGAILTQDRSTGLFVLKPIRANYDVEDLQVFDESNVIAIDSYQRPALPDAVNEVSVKFTDIATGNDGSVTVQNLANITAQGGVVTQGKAYPGLPTSGLALRVAMRDLKAVSTPLARVRMRTTRAAYVLLPGDVILLDWPKLGITGLVLRVLTVNTGTVTDGPIDIEAIEDVFGMSSTTYAAQPPIGWTDPSTGPAVASRRVVREANFYELQRALGAEAAAALPADAGFVLAAAVRPSGDSLDFGMHTRTGSEAYAEVARAPFAPAGTLLAAMLHADTAATLETMTDVDLVTAGGYAQVGNEIVRIDTVDADTGALTLGRGALGTVAAAHDAGTRIYFLDGYTASDPEERVDAEAVGVKLTPRTGRGQLAIGDAPTDIVTLDQVAYRPYPPGRLLIQGEAYPTLVEDSVVALEWAHRNRLQQNLEGDESGDIGPEAGTTYSVELRNATTDALLHSASSIVGTSDNSVPIAGIFPLRVLVWAMRSGLASAQRHDYTLDFSNPLSVTAPAASLAAAAAHVGPSSLVSFSAVVFRAAGVMMSGDTWESQITIGYMGTGSPSSMPAGAVLTIQVDHDLGASIVSTTVSYTLVSSSTKSAARSTFTSMINTNPALIAGGFTAAHNDTGEDTGWIELYGPAGDVSWSVVAYPPEPPPAGASEWWGFYQTVAPGSGQKIVRVTLTGTPARGDAYTITLDGVDFRFVGRLADTLTTIAANLAALIDAHASYAATNEGAVVVIDGLTNTNDFTYSATADGARAYGTEAANSVGPGNLFSAASSLIAGEADAGDPFYSSIGLLLHFDGSDGSTTFTDNGPSPKSVAANGNAKLDTTVKMFGTAALELDGTGDYATTANHSSLDFVTGDFTIEFWAYLTATQTSKVAINKGVGTGFFPWQIWFNGSSRIGFRGYNNVGGAIAFDIADTASHALNTWVPIAAVRDGNTFRLYVGGTQVATASFSGTLYTDTASVSIGAYSTGAASMAGYIDELRITKGVARYTGASYTPQTDQFSNG